MIRIERTEEAKEVSSKEMNKTANWLDTVTKGALGLGSLVTAGSLMHKVYNDIKNDYRRKALLKDLHDNDPVLKEVPEDTILEWYATIYNFAPRLSLDKNAVRELLQTFTRFGRVDLNTLQSIAKTEESMAKARSGETGWGEMLYNLTSGYGNPRA